MKNKTFKFTLLLAGIFALTFAPASLAQFRFDYPITVFEPVELIVKYIHVWQYDTSDVDLIRNEDMILLLGKTKSKFLSDNYYINDTIYRKLKSHEEYIVLRRSPERPLPSTAFMFQIYKNDPEGKMTITDYVIGNHYLYREVLDLFDWTLSGETRTIKGYTAQKATCNFGGRTWIAWFTPEIPYSDGPYKFNGLPGLILNIRDTKDEYIFEFLSIEKPASELMIDRTEKDFVETTKFEFFRAKDSFYENIISNAKEAGLSGSSQQRAARNAAKMNNRIELIRK